MNSNSKNSVSTEKFAKSLNGVIGYIKRRISTLMQQHDAEILGQVLNAYNRYQEDERDGADYIFDFNNPDDLKCMVSGGLTAQEIAWGIEFAKQNGYLPLYRFGDTTIENVNLTAVGNRSDLIRLMDAYLDTIIPYVILYPYVDEYKVIYLRALTEVVENSDYLRGEVMGV